VDALAAEVIARLERDPLLLEADPEAESLVSIVVGHSVRGSWWGHPLGGSIYRVSGVVLHHPDVLVAKLLAGKVTLVHRTLWPQVLAVAVAREPWQLERLSVAAATLLETVDTEDEVRVDRVAVAGGPKAARELERVLLCHSRELHTETGAHTKVLTTWQRWIDQHSIAEPLPPARIAKAELNRVLGRLNQRWGTRFRLPWESALESHPYEADPELAWEAPPGPDLPYEGAVPADVLRLARRRRAAR